MPTQEHGVSKEQRGPDPFLPGERVWGRKEPAGTLIPCQQQQLFGRQPWPPASTGPASWIVACQSWARCEAVPRPLRCDTGAEDGVGDVHSPRVLACCTHLQPALQVQDERHIPDLGGLSLVPAFPVPCVELTLPLAARGQHQIISPYCWHSAPCTAIRAGMYVVLHPVVPWAQCPCCPQAATLSIHSCILTLSPAGRCPLQHPALHRPVPAVPPCWHPGRFGDTAQPHLIPQFPLSHTELPPSEFMQVADSTWLVLSVVSNGCAPSGCQATGVTKIARSVIAPLAEHHVSVLMLSTYQTDFILVSSVGTVPRGPGPCGRWWGPR